MGQENYSLRLKGPWSLEESLLMFNLVCEATQVQILRKQRSVEIDPNPAKPKKFELVGNVIKVYKPELTQLADVIPLLVKENRAKKNLRSIDLVISWKTIAQHLKTRSVDDIRNFWQLRVLPLFDSTSQVKTQWTEDDDLQLLEQIIE